MNIYGLMQFPRELVKFLDLSVGDLSKPLPGAKMQQSVHKKKKKRDQEHLHS